MFHQRAATWLAQLSRCMGHWLGRSPPFHPPTQSCAPTRCHLVSSNCRGAQDTFEAVLRGAAASVATAAASPPDPRSLFTLPGEPDAESLTSSAAAGASAVAALVASLRELQRSDAAVAIDLGLSSLQASLKGWASLNGWGRALMPLWRSTWGCPRYRQVCRDGAAL
eukprot:352734-Chlamydomonas_euryale.AAC.1